MTTAEIANVRRHGLALDLQEHAHQLGLLLDESREILTEDEARAIDGARRLSWAHGECLRRGWVLPDVDAVALAAYTPTFDEAAALLAALRSAPPCPVSALPDLDETHALVATGPRRA